MHIRGGIITVSESWSKADAFVKYWRERGAQISDDIATLRVGDVIAYDYGTDTVWDHVVVVTGIRYIAGERKLLISSRGYVDPEYTEIMLQRDRGEITEEAYQQWLETYDSSRCDPGQNSLDQLYDTVWHRNILGLRMPYDG